MAPERGNGAPDYFRHVVARYRPKPAGPDSRVYAAANTLGRLERPLRFDVCTFYLWSGNDGT